MDTLTNDFCVLYQSIIIKGPNKFQENLTVRRWGERDMGDVPGLLHRKLKQLHSSCLTTAVMVATLVIIGKCHQRPLGKLSHGEGLGLKLYLPVPVYTGAMLMWSSDANDSIFKLWNWKSTFHTVTHPSPWSWPNHLYFLTNDSSWGLKLIQLKLEGWTWIVCKHISSV